MIPRLFAATGAVLLWAYARACRERNATQRRLARATLLRQVSARPTRCADCGREDGGCDRVVTVDITPDTSRLEQTLSKGGRPTVPWELPPALQGVPPEKTASLISHFGLDQESPERKGYPW